MDKYFGNSTPSEPIISKELWDEVATHLPNIMKDMIENNTRYTREELIEMLKVKQNPS